MTPKQEPQELVWKLLDRSISEEEFARLNRCLVEDPELRRFYQSCIEADHALEAIAAAEAPVASKATAEPLVPINVRPRRLKLKLSSIAWLAAAAGWLLALFIWSNRSTPSNADQLGQLGLLSHPFNVSVASATHADWRGETLQVGDVLSGHMLHLQNGEVELDFPTQTRVRLRGPAFFQVRSDDTLHVGKGEVTVTHKGEPGRFSLVTPTGILRDLGTKFGASIGNSGDDSLVLTQVFEGKVAFENVAGGEDRVIHDGEAVSIRGRNEDRPSILKKHGQAFLSDRLDAPVPAAQTPQTRRNLAANKPVLSSGYWGRPNDGEFFPASNINDGRTDDTGIPGDWSFWLLPEQSTGWVAIDLEEAETISLIEVQNTRNRWHCDRATARLRIDVSMDGTQYQPLLVGDLDASVGTHNAGKELPFQSFRFDPIEARYVRLHVETYARRGGGLNEVRVFN